MWETYNYDNHRPMKLKLTKFFYSLDSIMKLYEFEYL